MTRNRRIYLDNAATTRPAPEVVEAMMPWLGEEYGNPATLYTPGREAEEAVQSAREAVAALLHADSPGEIFFTSGGTESDNWALFGSAFAGEKRHIITSAVEHHAVLETCEHLERLGAGISVTVLPVDARGRIAPKDLESAIRDDTALVSIMHANNEIGTVQPIAELADTAHARGVPFHTDAVQTVGKMDVDVRALGADMLSLSAHKFHGPKGVGALYIRKGTRLLPFIRGGGQEKFRRAGTTNVPGVVGLGRAARLAENTDFAAEGRRLSALREKLWTGLTDSIPQLTRNGDPGATLPGMLNITFAGIEGEAILLMLDMQGICVSSGSACTTGSLEPSHVLLATGVPVESAHGSLRFSMSRYTTEEEIDAVSAALTPIVHRLREMSPTWTAEPR